MNGKITKKIKKIVKRDANDTINDFIDTVEKLPFKLRLSYCWRLLTKKL